ncbi:MAG: hypothetical protein LBL00_05675 [Endomicrobium sp.]|jgi:hypothetical protein|nr:hypothetical protein [Endomicrobium sp.]
MRNNIIIASVLFAALVLIFPEERGLLDKGRFEEGFIYNIERSTSGISSPKAHAARGIGLSGPYAEDDEDFINGNGIYGSNAAGGGFGGYGSGDGSGGTSGVYGYGGSYQNERNRIFIAYTELELPETFRIQRFGVKEKSEIVITSTATITVDEKEMEKIKAQALEEAKISVAAEMEEAQAAVEAAAKAQAAAEAAAKEAKAQAAAAAQAAKLKAQKDEEARQRAAKSKKYANGGGADADELDGENSKSGKAKSDYNYYNKIIKDSRKTFFFPDNFKTISDVAVGVYTATPYEDKHIIKFQIKNDSTSYFFIANISLYKEGAFVICDYHNDSMVSGGRILEGIIVSPVFQSKEKIMLKLIESSGKNRNYEINFIIP